MKPTLRRILIALAILTILAIGVAFFIVKNDVKSPGNDTGEERPVLGAFESASPSFGDAATTAPSEPTDPLPWDVTWMRARKVGFTPPAGYWVYESELRGEFSLVPGSPPAPGSPDPADEVQHTRVASMIPVMRDAVSFPTWERFRLTMAQFQCASGTTDEDLVICLDKPKNAIAGKTQAGLPYEKFSLEAVRKIDQAPRGLRTFVMVRLGEANDSGVLISVLDETAGAAPALQLAKSMRIQESPSAP